MENQACLKCGGEMDEGTVSVSEGVKYISNRQTSMLKVVTPARRARVCLACGYMELYLDAAELRKKIGK
ncbi:MAG: hypothetical protein Fur0044_39950 [Anaerolineae bacterium]|nr:hypothetical protein [Anaerolineales bacterium]MCQ3972166.1 hypothetical protein [Anaerolineae bacterium]